ncbi:MAG: hypothetical protein JO202_19555 [Ktedonobacteraceae bacterium]|nr:hypothetical protein [Ktedonobacteraceae bacterium]
MNRLEGLALTPVLMVSLPSDCHGILFRPASLHYWHAPLGRYTILVDKHLPFTGYM